VALTLLGSGLAMAAPATMTVALCAPGLAVDAALFHQDYYAADGARRQLVVVDKPASVATCATTEIGAADVRWAGLVPADRLDGQLRFMALQGRFSAESVVVSEIIDTTATMPVTLTPRAAATNPSADTPSFEPAPAREHTRSAWLWSPALWQDSAELIWRLQEQRQLNAVYVTVPVDADGALENASALTAFIQQATAHDLQVWAVIGDRQDVLAVSRAALQKRLQGYRNYNDTAAANARLAGVQLDIEPYLLPGFALAQDIWRERYLDVLAFARSQLGDALALDLVVPGWWGSHPDWSEEFLNRLDTRGLSLTVMNYQTAPARLLEIAEPFLTWGQRVGVPVRMALETGRLSDETRHYYSPTNEAGELWLIDVAGTPVLLLLAAPVAGLPGTSFTFADEAAVPAATYTFAGDLPRLDAVLAEVVAAWGPAPAFAGIALHGLEETLTP
jgi:hypothetical protein